jgi:hypothetical protein
MHPTTSISQVSWRRKDPSGCPAGHFRRPSPLRRWAAWSAISRRLRRTPAGPEPRIAGRAPGAVGSLIRAPAGPLARERSLEIHVHISPGASPCVDSTRRRPPAPAAPRRRAAPLGAARRLGPPAPRLPPSGEPGHGPRTGLSLRLPERFSGRFFSVRGSLGAPGSPVLLRSFSDHLQLRCSGRIRGSRLPT